MGSGLQLCLCIYLKGYKCIWECSLWVPIVSHHSSQSADELIAALSPDTELGIGYSLPIGNLVIQTTGSRSVVISGAGRVGCLGTFKLYHTEEVYATLWDLSGTNAIKTTHRYPCPTSSPMPSKKKRYVFIWTCCSCSCAGQPIMVENCANCGTPRCGSCYTQKVIQKHEK